MAFRGGKARRRLVQPEGARHLSWECLSSQFENNTNVLEYRDKITHMHLSASCRRYRIRTSLWMRHCHSRTKNKTG